MSVTAQAIDYDKKLHIGVSTVIATTVYIKTTSWQDTMTVCLGVGLAKELYDEVSYGGFDTKDLAADLVGCGLGIALGHTTLQLWQSGDATGLQYKRTF